MEVCYIFKVDSPLYEFFRRFRDVLVLNFLWFIFSLPIITIGASNLAVYSVTMKMVEDKDGYIGKEFIKAFKSNFKQSILLEILTAGVLFVIYLNIRLYFLIESRPLPLLIVGIFSSVYFWLSLLYAYPLSARYKNSLMNTLSNSFQISTKYIWKTILLTIIVGFVIITCLYNTTTMFFGILMGPTFIMFTISSFTLPIFRKIEEENKTQGMEDYCEK